MKSLNIIYKSSKVHNVLDDNRRKPSRHYTIIMVALGSLGMSISFPTGPVIFTSALQLMSPGNQIFSRQVVQHKAC